MAVLGIVAKLRVPYAHTSLEFIRIRYGAYAHGIFVVLNLINNIFGCGGMILAGAQLVSGMTGMHIAATGILIPAGVVIYTAVGGLKATFLTDFLHTTVALILLIYFSLAVLTNEHIGGVYGLYDKVMAAEVYIEGNYAGSLLSAKSRGGTCSKTGKVKLGTDILTNLTAILFGLVLKFGNLALVVMDTAFWQKSFASDVNSTVPAYDLASIVILAVPWCTGTIIGLSARAIENNPVWVLYPNTLSKQQVNSGMVMPYVLKSLLGRGATEGLLVLIFMAITSTVSSSMIAVSSIISLDFYRTYINPTASDKKTLQVSHIGVIFHGAFMAGFALMLNYAGATNNWSNYFRPIISCPGIFPMMLTILWSGQTKAAAILSPILGLISGVTTWLVLSWHWGGALNIQTTQQQLPGLYGAIVSFFSPAVFSVAISLAKPSRFDWRIFLKLDLITEKDNSTHSSPPSAPASTTTGIVPAETDISDNEKRSRNITDNRKVSPTLTTTYTADDDLDNVVHPMSPETLRHVRKWLRIASIFFVVNVVVTLILWPLPLYRDYIFTRSFFGGWVTVAIIWHFAAMGAVIVYPCYDGWESISTSVRGIGGDLRRVLRREGVKG